MTQQKVQLSIADNQHQVTITLSPEDAEKVADLRKIAGGDYVYVRVMG